MSNHGLINLIKGLVANVFSFEICSKFSTSHLSEQVTIEKLDGDHHFFVEEEKARVTAKLISDFINSN